MKLLMTEDDVSFDGRHYRLSRASYNPKPFQEPHPPIWIGGGGERKMLPLVARRADVWHGFGDVERLVRRSALIDREAREARRDPASIRRSTSLSLSEPWDEVRRRLELLGEAGFDYFTVSWPSEGKGRLDEFVSDVMPHHAG
jgi:alkanesulfonate monooxygenase SsuD/methylene tetrahydromethanopterin reductase-like flavin-dependent oxidoreductase (luciferase family)